MIKIDDLTDLTFVSMGLFDTDSEWIHPARAIDSYELIYVSSGKVELFEENERISLGVGELLVLEPGKKHGGAAVSRGHTSFFWLHFLASDFAALAVPKKAAPPAPATERTLREIMHLQSFSRVEAELVLARFLLELGDKSEKHSGLGYELDEYIRVNARKAVAVSAVAARFGFNADYLSRVYKREFGVDLKTGIIKKRLEYIESQLLNTHFSIKDIAAACDFPDENAFVKFFKYHEGTTPSDFRDRFFYTHLNDK